MVGAMEAEGTRALHVEGWGSESIAPRRTPDSSNAVRVIIHAMGIREPAALDILVSDIEEREEEMRMAALTFGVPPDRWRSSLIFQKYAEEGLTEIHVKPEEDCLERNYASFFQWNEWLTRLIEQYYKTSKLRIPDKCQGVDLLLALEYFGILYQPDQLVFATFASYKRVQQWSHYFTHRGSLAEWVVSIITQFPGDVIHRFSSSPDLTEGWMEVEDKRVAILEGEDPPETTAQAHEIFNNSMVAAELRNDFALFLSKLLGHVYVDFDVKPVAIKSTVAPSIYEDRAVLVIKTTVKNTPKTPKVVRIATDHMPRAPSNDQARVQHVPPVVESHSIPKDFRESSAQRRSDIKSSSAEQDHFLPGEVVTFQKSASSELKALVSNLMKPSTDMASSGSPKSVSDFDSLSRALESKRSDMMHSAEHIYEDLAKDVGVMKESEDGGDSRNSASPQQSNFENKKGIPRIPRSKDSKSEPEKEKAEYRALAPLLSADSEDDDGRLPLNEVRARRSDLHSVTSALTGPFFIDEYGHVRDVFDNNDDDARAQALRHEWIQGGILNRGIQERIEALLRKEEKPEVEEAIQKEVVETPQEQTDLLAESWDWLTGLGMCNAITAESREGAVQSLNNTVSSVLNGGKQIFLQCNDAIHFPPNSKPTSSPPEEDQKLPGNEKKDIPRPEPEPVPTEAKKSKAPEPSRSPAKVKDRMVKVQRYLEQSREDSTPLASVGEVSDRREGNSMTSTKSTITTSNVPGVQTPSNPVTLADPVEKKPAKKRVGWGIGKPNTVKAKGETTKNEKKKGFKGFFWKRRIQG